MASSPTSLQGENNTKDDTMGFSSPNRDIDRIISLDQVMLRDNNGMPAFPTTEEKDNSPIRVSNSEAILVSS